MTEIAQSIHALLAGILLTFLQFDPPAPPDEAGAAPSIRPQAEAAHREAARLVADEAEFWSAPFVLANRETREIWVWGQVTGMIPGDPVEFFVIYEQSGQDYESLMVTFAKPSDIHKALEFIGLEPGGPVDPARHRFWPRGDHVVPTFSFVPKDAEEPVELPAHEWIVHPDESVMEPSTWVFTGAPLLPDPRDPDTLVYAADAFGPNSVASTFNLRNTLFDLPKQGSKTGMYGHYNRNPAIEVAEAAPALLHLTPPAPEHLPPEKDLLIRVLDAEATLQIEGLPDVETLPLADLPGTLAEQSGPVFWMTVDMAPETPLSTMIDFAKKMEAIEDASDALRVEPPPAGQLYYQAYNPEARFRDRNNRPTQPLELQLRLDSRGQVNAHLIEIEEQWGDGRRPNLIEHRHDLTSPEAWGERIANDPPLVKVLFVFAPGDLTHQALMKWLTPVLDTFPVVFVYDLEN